MGCNCQGQNPWANEAQADIDAAQNGGHHHDDDEDDENSDDDEDRDEEDQDDFEEGRVMEDDFARHPPHQPTVNNGAIPPPLDDFPPIPVPTDVDFDDDFDLPLPPNPPQPQPAEPTTLTVRFNDIHTVTGGGWVPAPAPQRNPISGALEWVFTRVANQNNGNTQTIDTQQAAQAQVNDEMEGVD